MEPIPSSPSVPPEDAELVGVDPDDTDSVRIGGATFVLGVIPAGIWENINAKWHMEYQDATRRIIKELAAKGIDPEAARDHGLMAWQEAIMFDPQHSIVDNNLHVEALSYSLLSMKGFVNKKKVAFPFKRTRVSFAGIEVERCTPETMKTFEANPNFTATLWLRIRRLNTLGVPEKKD